jgi:hypothetical protein
VIPANVGSLESGPGEALLAHELTHVAQRVRYGPTLPDESAPAGRVLEAEARAAEMVLDTGASLRSMPVAPPRAPDAPTWAGALGDNAAGSDAGTPLPLVAPTATGPDIDLLAASILDRVSALTGQPATPGATIEFTPESWSMGPAPAPAMTGGGIQRAEDVAPPVANPPTPAPKPDEQVAGSMSRPSDEDLTNLSKWLYPLIKYRLKGELREDRERAGLVTDHYRRW